MFSHCWLLLQTRVKGCDTVKEFFPGISKLEKAKSKTQTTPCFHRYDGEEMLGGKKMKDHLRYSMAYWHTLTGSGMDPFGAASMERPWSGTSNPMMLAEERVYAAFELMQKLDIGFFCFHDRDVAPEGATLAETNKNLDKIVKLIREQMDATGIKLLWGTACLFTNPRYMHGAATSPNADAFAYAAGQVKKALEVTHELGGGGYTFWGGREGYETLLNTDMKLEQDNLARFLHMAADYAKEIGFTGQFYIEPKPKEPTKHQYDFDVANGMAFLRGYGLDKILKFNIEANHATLAGHTFQHELRLARINGILGSVDANMGDMLLGWDTDQFPTNLYDTTLCMYEILKMGGFTTGGLNFDAKVRRGSFTVEDLFFAHAAGMDAFAVGLKAAQAIISDGAMDKLVDERYASYTSGIGRDIVDGKVGFKELERYALGLEKVQVASGRQEMLESILNEYILGVK
jgi:xylose isomerase